MWNGIAVVVAVIAFVFSVAQWMDRRRSDYIRLLLGERETVAYEAFEITHHPARKISGDAARALVLSTLFLGSDRARLQVYEALDTIGGGPARAEIVGARSRLGGVLEKYGPAFDEADTRNYTKRLAQLDKALPWITGQGS